MIKNFFFFIFFFSLMLSSCISWKVEDFTQVNKNYIIFIYLDADNNLDSYAQMDIDEILEGSKKNPNIAYFVYYDGREYNDTKLMYIDEGTTYTVKKYGELDSGDYHTISKVLLDIEDYVNNNYEKFGNITFTNLPLFIVFWDHGTGWLYKNKYLCIDDTSNSLININKLVEVLKFVNKYIHKIDLLGFDACLMGNLETLYSIFINNITNYIIASELEEPAYGWDYNIKIDKLDPYSISKTFIDAYANYYENVSPSTFSLALYEKNNTLELVKKLNLLSEELINTENNSFIYLKEATKDAVISSDYPFADFKILFKNLSNYYPLDLSTLDFPIYVKTNTNKKSASITIPGLPTFDLYKDYFFNSTINPLINTTWGKFLRDYENYLTQ